MVSMGGVPSIGGGADGIIMAVLMLVVVAVIVWRISN